MSLVCRSCGDPELTVVLSLGSTPLANALRELNELDDPEARYPLRLAVCGGCSLAQLAETVPPAVLFADYPYLSSWSDTMLRHSERMAFFDRRFAESLVHAGTSARLVVANNVMAHVPNLNDVVGGIRRLLAPDGVFVLGTPYLRDLLDRVDDTTLTMRDEWY